MLHVIRIHYTLLDLEQHECVQEFDSSIDDLPRLIRSLQDQPDVRTITNIEIEDLHGLNF